MLPLIVAVRQRAAEPRSALTEAASGGGLSAVLDMMYVLFYSLYKELYSMG
jgi:hypothetical protein